MGRQKRKQKERGRLERERPRPRSRAQLLRASAGGATFLLAVAVGVWLVTSGRVRLPGGGLEFPPPRDGAAEATGITMEDFAGAESCEECHETEYQAWRKSTHGRAGGAPSRDLVLAPFDGKPIRFLDADVIPTVTADGRYQFVVNIHGRQPQVISVDGVVGGGHLEGGGTQGFVSRFPDGTVRFLPFEIVKREGVWFCNTISRTRNGWAPITPRMALAECGDWPPVRILGTDARYANCQECHAARVELSFDRQTGRFSTRIPSLAIDCESCHGPLAEHVKRSDSTRIHQEPDLAVEALVTWSKDGSVKVCLRCHGVKDVMQPGYLPGKPLERYYSLGFPLLGGDWLFPDGRIRSFAYQENHRFSDCYLNGSMTCVDCHDPHSQQYRDIRGRSLLDRFSDEQCLDCHPSKRERPEEHTYHRPGTVGSKCVECHMPYLQQPEVGNHLRYARSDHTIPIPRPGDDDRMGVVNACSLSGCHPSWSMDSVQTWMVKWYGELKPRKPIVTAMLEADRLDDMRGAVVLLDTTAAHPAAQLMALGVFVSRFLSPDMPGLAPDVERALRSLSRAPDLDLRSAALAALHLARGGDRTMRTFLAHALEMAGADDAALRARWATTLGTFGDTYMRARQWDEAIRAYRKALEVRPGNAALLVNLGLVEAYAGDYRGAAQTLGEAIEVDPQAPLAWVNLGFVRENLGDAAGAEVAYRNAITADNSEPLAHFNLANVLARRGQLASAIKEYEMAVELNPTLKQAQWRLVETYVASGRGEDALASARRWSRITPDDPSVPLLIAEIEKVLRAP